MKNIFVNRIKLFAAAVSLLLICSCSDDFSGTVQDKNYPSKDGKTYLCLSAALSPEARSIAPGASDYAVSNLTNLVLSGKLSSDTGAETQLASASAYDIINGKNIPVSGAGSWTFTLTADLNGIPFKGTVEQEITEGSVNTLSFTLGTEQTQGGMSITFKFTGSSTKASDYKVNAILMTQDKEVIETKTFENTEDDPSAIVAYSSSSTNTTFYVVYSRSSSDEAEYLESGTYYLLFEVYDKRTVVEDSLNTSDSVPLNTSRNFVRVDKGITTTAELSLTLNDVYSITYNYNEGEELAADAVMILNYSRKSAGIKLPLMVKDGYEFAGWYDNKNFEGDPVSEISPGTTGNLTFWACFTEETEEKNVLYVSPKGSETNTGSLDSIAAAVAKIIENPNPDANWTIKIDGILTGPQKIEDISEDHAASLTICGANALDSEGNPSDKIIADTNNPGSHALSISASLPVTIKDIKITKGEDGEDDPSYGVYVGYDSRIYLAGTPVIDDLYVDSNEYYDWETEEYYGAISIFDDLGDKASVTITPAYESHYPYFDDYESHEVIITKYVYTVNGLDVSDYCKYFHVTPKEDSTEAFFIDEYGRINKNVIVNLVSLQTNQNFTKTVLYGSDTSKLGISLNDYTGWTFAGWFTSDDEGETLKDKVTLIYEEGLTLYAKWVQPVDDLYVNAGDGGSDKNAGTSESPLKTVSAAVAKIKDFGVARDYTIHVTEMCTEEGTITLDENIIASSITFIGDSTVESGIKNKSSGSTPLAIEAAFTVTLNNFSVCADGFVNLHQNTLALYVGYGADVILGNGTKIYRENEDTTAAKAGVYIYDATLTMKGNSQIYGFDPGFSGNSDTNGSGGVLIEENGNLIMYDNSSIYNCRAENKGGAIHLASGSVVMNDSASIGGNGKACSASTDGGAVYMSGGDFVMNDSSSISYCTKGSNGYGSIYIAGGIFTMNGGSINNNTGGVHVEKANDSNTKVEFIMEDGSISNNGIGVYVACATNDNTSSGIFDMRGGTISDNTEHGVQVEAYVSRDVGYKSYSGTFKMSKGALVKPSNDVYLGYNSYTHPYYNETYTSQARILITDALDGDDSNQVKATVTLQNYTEDAQIIEADDGVVLEYELEGGTFAVTPQTDGDGNEIKWTISNEGKLVKQE